MEAKRSLVFGDNQMKQLKSTAADLEHTFKNQLRVAHICENIVRKPHNADAATVKQFIQAMDFDVVGITKDVVVGYVSCDELLEGTCDQYKREFLPGDLVSDSTNLLEILQLLRYQRRCFVLIGNKVEGIVMRGDLQKAPVRMFLSRFFK